VPGTFPLNPEPFPGCQAHFCYIAHWVYGFTEHAARRYASIGIQRPGEKRADACTQCGACEPKCPQHIPIRQQLRAVAAALGPTPPAP